MAIDNLQVIGDVAWFVHLRMKRSGFVLFFSARYATVQAAHLTNTRQWWNISLTKKPPRRSVSLVTLEVLAANVRDADVAVRYVMYNDTTLFRHSSLHPPSGRPALTNPIPFPPTTCLPQTPSPTHSTPIPPPPPTTYHPHVPGPPFTSPTISLVTHPP